MKIQLNNKKVLPFYFEEFENEYLLTNMFREYFFLKKNEFNSFIRGSISDKNLLIKLQNKKFIYQGEEEIAASDYASEYRQRKAFLFEATSLHIFGVTENCNLKCVYCQVGSDRKKKQKHMSKETARKSVDIAIESPSNFLAFEFQGGEPLINFEVIKEIVTYSKSKDTSKSIEFRLVTNLTLMNDEIFRFIKDNGINISVSLDGDERLHNINRPYKNGRGSFKNVSYWIKKFMNIDDIQVSALPTITRQSFNRVEQLLDTYTKFGFKNIFIRFLSPFGSASKNWNEIGYSAEEFITFYEAIFDKIISYNNKNLIIAENYASIILSKILTKNSVNFMDLRSPCGAGIGQIAYNWDGNIFTCDEGRMLAAEGDNTFKIGNVNKDSYGSCMKNDNLKYVLSASLLDSLVDCTDCPYSPFCGVCPLYNYKTKGSLFIKMKDDYRCKIFKGIYRHLFSKIKENNKNIMKIFYSWVNHD